MARVLFGACVFKSVESISTTANFRRSLSPPTTDATPTPDATFIDPTGKRAAAGPRGGRPAEFYRASTAWKTGSPIKRSRKQKNPTRPSQGS